MSNSRAASFLRNRAASEVSSGMAEPLDRLTAALMRGAVPLREAASLTGLPPEKALPLVQSLIDQGRASIMERGDLGGEKFLVATPSQAF